MTHVGKILKGSLLLVKSYKSEESFRILTMCGISEIVKWNVGQLTLVQWTETSLQSGQRDQVGFQIESKQFLLSSNWKPFQEKRDINQNPQFQVWDSWFEYR